MNNAISKKNINKILGSLKDAGASVTISIDFKENGHKKKKRTKQTKNQKRWYDREEEGEKGSDHEVFDLKAMYKTDFYKRAFREYFKGRYHSDPLFRLSMNIRTSIAISIKNRGFTKPYKTEKILGCTIKEFKEYIESKWSSWMNWDNYGNRIYDPKKINNSWDLDHIIPVSSAKTQEDIIKLNHYSNFQPLCSVNNRHIKKDKIKKVA